MTNMLHSPLRYRKGMPVFITQKFGVNPNAYAHLGIDGHNGIDFVAGVNMDAYGIGIVATHDATVIRVVANEPMSTKGNGVYTQFEEGGKLFMEVYWHLAEACVTAGQKVKRGQLLGRMGNSGTVRPVPTMANPFLGTHLHYGLYVSEMVNDNWQRISNNFDGAVDPMPYFSAHTISKNFNEYLEYNSLERMKVVLYPFIWAIDKIKQGLNKL